MTVSIAYRDESAGLKPALSQMFISIFAVHIPRKIAYLGRDYIVLGGLLMVHVLVHHKVADFYRWKESFDSYLNTRKQAGELGAHVFQAVDDPRDITVLVDWDSIEHARRFMSSEELRNRMQQAGVVGTPDIRYVEDVHAVRRTAAD